MSAAEVVVDLVERTAAHQEVVSTAKAVALMAPDLQPVRQSAS